MNPSDVVVGQGQDQVGRQAPLESYRRTQLIWRAQIIGEFVNADRKTRDRLDAEWVREARVIDDHLALAHTIETQRLSQLSFFELLIEDSRAAADDQVLAFERRQGKPQTRREIVAV